MPRNVPPLTSPSGAAVVKSVEPISRPRMPPASSTAPMIPTGPLASETPLVRIGPLPLSTLGSHASRQRAMACASPPRAARTPAARAAARRPRRGRPAGRAAGRRSPARRRRAAAARRGMSGSSGVIGVSRSLTASPTRSTGGRTPLLQHLRAPSTRRWFSSSAIMCRQVTAVPLSVCTWRGPRRGSGCPAAATGSRSCSTSRSPRRSRRGPASTPRGRTSSRPRSRGRRRRC